jgi:transcriptional regulator with XRE-family HTH domain
MSRMSDTGNEHGPALAAWLDTLRGDISMRRFMDARNYDDARVSQWRLGKPPSIGHMRELADALGMSLGEILIRARYGTLQDFTVIQPVERTTIALREAIDASNLDEAQRALISHLLDTFEGAPSARKPRTVMFRLPPTTQ